MFYNLGKMLLSFSKLSLVGCMGACGFLSYICFTSPNPPPPKLYEKDRLMMSGRNHTLARKWWFTLAFSYHMALILLPDISPRLYSSICVNPDVLNQGLVTWSWITGPFVCLIFLAAPIRLRAYSGLGKDFTFVLAKPKKLVTTGIYHYVQHPSYTGLFFVVNAWYWAFMRLDGVAVCVLPRSIVTIKALTFAPSLIMSVFTVIGIRVRTRDEEEMLKKEFGKEWEAWNARTSKFIPGVF